MKVFLINLLNKVKRNPYVVYIFITFYAMDLITRLLASSVLFYPAYYPAPNLFTIFWIILFTGIITSMKGKGARIAFLIIFILSFVTFLTNNIYFSLTDFFFTFNLLELAGEGSSYIWNTIVTTSPLIYISAVFVIAMGVFTFIKIPTDKKFNPKRLLIFIVIFIAGHAATPLVFGSSNDNLKWNTFKKAGNVYSEYNDCNKSMKVSGLYEYTLRSMYVYYLRPEEKISDEDKKFLDECYNKPSNPSPSKYAGMFKGKNVIMLQLEGMDSWLLSKEYTPNLWALKNSSIDFTDHYSIYSGGGSTFNSEFAINVGFTTPISYIQNVYLFNNNTFNETLPKLFKNEGYSANCYHMNTGDFYSRNINYLSWGYDAYHGMMDECDYDNDEFELDSVMIEDENFYNQLFKDEQPFLKYIISYTPHTPFNSRNKAVRLLTEKYGIDNIDDYSEEGVARLMVKETDNMVGELIQGLKDNGLYDNTVIVAYADHFLYTLKDRTALDKYKNTSNNLINNTPFFIWSSDTTYTPIKDVTMQLNIMPTVLGLFGIDYNTNSFLLKDALSDDYEGIAFFSDYSWYDGNVYVENGKVTNDGTISDADLKRKNDMVSDLIRKNDLTLKYNYFKDK